MSRFRMKNWRRMLLWMACVLGGYASSGLALELDSTFGQEGVVTTRVGYYEDKGRAVAVQSDGKIVVAGSSSNNVNLDLAVVRYNPDGGLDLDFNGNGQVVTAFGNGDDLALDVALQQDGKIVVCGQTFTESGNDIVLLRLLDDGSYDPDFGINGVVTLAIGGGDDTASAVAIQDDGRILVAGTVTDGGQTNGVVLRFLSNGFVDPSFGTQGKVKIAQGESFLVADLALQVDQKVVVLGNSTQDKKATIVVTRFLPSGEIDTTFGTDNRVQLSGASGIAQGNGVAVQKDGAILVAGTTGQTGARDVAVFRLTAGGRSDSSFGDNGVLRYGTSDKDEVATDVLVSGAAFFVSGFTATGEEHESILLESSLAGTQTTLSVVQSQAGQVGENRALALQAGSKVIAVGQNGDSGTSSIILARYATSESAEDTTVATSKAETAYILTTAPSEITRVGCVTGGEVYKGSGQTFTARGVVYSLAPYPSLPTEETVTTDEDTDDAVDSTDDVAAKEGYTRNGKGEGRFGTVLSELSPGTLYYVRAYGVTEDGDVMYGNQVSFTTEDSCFIATAAYGSLLHPHVRVLRQFRDQYLLKFAAGRWFVRNYYEYSPALANRIANSGSARFLVRLGLLPFIAGGYTVVHLGITGFVVLGVLAIGGFGLLGRWLRFRRKEQHIQQQA